MKLAYCTGFWATNVGNGFFSLGVEHVLKNIIGNENVTMVSDYQTYANGVGKRNWPHKNQLQYISKLDVDYIVISGPILSKYFLPLWKETLLELEKRGVGYMLISVGMMKMTDEALAEIKDFFEKHPPYVLTSREVRTYEAFGKYAKHAYDGICFAFFAPDYYSPAKMDYGKEILTLNFDKMVEPKIELYNSQHANKNGFTFEYEDEKYFVSKSKFNSMSAKTDRFTDALVYMRSMFPQAKRNDEIGKFKVIRTDHRFYPHYRSKMYAQKDTFAYDLPYAYLNVYANSDLTLSDRVHACAITLAYGNTAMLFAHTGRVGLLDRVGASEVSNKPIKLDLDNLNKEKTNMVNWLESVLK